MGRRADPQGIPPGHGRPVRPDGQARPPGVRQVREIAGHQPGRPDRAAAKAGERAHPGLRPEADLPVRALPTRGPVQATI